jgi:hypothetical protein
MKPARLILLLLSVSATLAAQSHPVSLINPLAATELSSRTFQADPAIRGRMVEAYGRLPLAFEVNQGQIDPEVKFLSRGAGYNLFLTQTEAVLTLGRVSHQRTDSTTARGLPSREEESAVLRMTLAGANAKTRVLGQDELHGKSNYFRGNDPKKWQTNVPQYARVRYTNVYPGMDLVYYGNQRELEYDFVLRPGADPGQIRLGIQGAKELRLEHGDLVLSCPEGEVLLRRPHIYQDANGKQRETHGHYVINNKSEVGFRVASYDRARTLVIDPVLAYSTYVGGSKEESGASIAVDSAGNAYIAGQDRGSTDFPTKNPIQSTYGGGIY